MNEILKISLAAARVNAGYKQKDAANKLEIDPATLRNWEQGRTIPDYKNVEKIENLYGINKDYIKF